MIRIKMLRLLSLLVVWGGPVGMLEKAIRLVKQDVICSALFEKYSNTIHKASPAQKMNYYKEIAQIKFDEIGNLKEHMRNIPHLEQKDFISFIIEELDQSARIIELPNQLGQQLFDILALADANFDEAFKKFTEEFLTPEKVVSFLNNNKAAIQDNWSEVHLVFQGIQKKFIAKLNQKIQNPAFVKNLEDCAKKIIDENPALFKRFNNILKYCDIHCALQMPTQQPKIYKYGTSNLLPLRSLV